MYAVKQVSLITAPGTRGISAPNVCVEKTQLLGIYAMLMYILIIFLRNACHIQNVFENSLAYVNVLRMSVGASGWSSGVFR